MRKIILLGLVASMLLNITACGRDITSNRTEIATKVKSVVQNREVTSGKEFTDEALEKLQNQLSFINADNIKNVAVTIAFSGKGYNSLNRDFYDVQIHGVIEEQLLTTELFLFTDETGKITDIGTWSRTLN